MIVDYLKKEALEKLKNNTLDNLKKYRFENEWLFDYIDKDFDIGHEELNIFIDFKNIKLDNSDKYDFENTKLIYNALKNLTPFQASNEQFWAYLTHYTFVDYMKERWPVDKTYQSFSKKIKNKKERDTNIQRYIKERYFLHGTPDRQLMRNGISRLWWYGYCSYDESKDNPYELTEVLLTIDSDITVQIVERNFSRNKIITLGILDAVKKYRDENPNVTIRPKFRNAMKMLIARSGVNVLDFMMREEVSDLVFSYLIGHKNPADTGMKQKVMQFL